jgi:ribosome biogenesis protein BMS1
VDAKFGFEMETFEFLNILQTHGFPKVMGVFTHLDQFRTAKNLRKTKKLLKHRFWTEIYDGAKMFYFSGVVNGKYLKNEVKQLTLFIQRVKVRCLLVYNTDAFVDVRSLCSSVRSLWMAMMMNIKTLVTSSDNIIM